MLFVSSRQGPEEEADCGDGASTPLRPEPTGRPGVDPLLIMSIEVCVMLQTEQLWTLNQPSILQRQPEVRILFQTSKLVTTSHHIALRQPDRQPES